MKTQTKILVVEDQMGPLESLDIAIRLALLKEKTPLAFPENAELDLTQRGIDVSRSYQDAQNFINNKCYDLIFLDHRLPYENQSELEKKDFDAFCRTLDGRGYYLIPAIKQKNPGTIVIGTSSLPRDELRQIPKPDYRLDKCGWDVASDLTKILEEIKTRGEEK
jgi:CheY-like chemotaxis protein